MNKLTAEIPVAEGPFVPLSTANRQRLSQVVLRFQQALAHLLMRDPTLYCALLTKENELPTLFELKGILEGTPCPLSDRPFLSYVSGILFALNCLDRDTGSLLYRHLFIRREMDQWQESFSHSAFYRVSNKAIDSLFRILDGTDFEFSCTKEAFEDNKL